MKYYKHLLFITISLLSLSTYAQTSKKTLNYQAVILDPKAIDIPGASIVGQPLNKGNVCLRFSLLNAQGGLDYEETQQVTTDEYGLVNVAIGAGAQAQAGNSTSIYKSFDSVLWNSSVKSLKVSVSYDGCNSFKQVSSQALNYTPYALYAEAVDYKNVREAPTKLSQFSNDAGYLIPKDLDPLKSDIQTNSSKIEVANKSIADNKQASEAAFLVVNQSITSLDTKVAEITTAIKENTSSITNINTKITNQQNQINDNRNQISTTNNNLNTQIGGLQGQLNTTNSTVSNLSGTAEVVSNKSTAVDLGGTNPSDQAYPSQKAAKAYVDQVVSQIATTGVPDATTLAAGKLQLAGDLGGTATNPTVPALANKENSNNKSTNVQTDAASDTKYPSVKAVKAYVDQATMGTALQATVDGKADKASPALTGIPTAPTAPANTSTTQIATTAFVQAATTGIALQASVDAKADKNSPTFTGTPTAPTPTLGDNSTKLATTAYVDAQVSAGAADATTTSKGIVRLTGDLGGTATSPTVPGLLLKEDVSNKSNAALGTSTTLYPTQNAVKTYVDTQVASATIADADATTRGKIQLTGDLGGTASSPTVPGLTAKANIASPTFTGTVTSPIYASAPQALTDAATISWNPANGLNANVTLGGNRTLSFSTAPASGSYGTLVVTQDATGGRTLTLPSGTNKVLGSASTTTIALSSAANAKDILNFYYDGLTSTYYWNVGQGYGIAETIESTNLASAVTGTLPVANGGTGAITATAALTALGAQASANLSTNITTDAASTTKYPAVKTIKDYVDAQVTSATIADADATTKGKLQLTGDLAGSATSPSVVKLRGTALSSVAPVTGGHVLTYDATGSGVAYWAAPANSANTISGVVPVANGGTGLSSVTNGGAVYASSSSALTTGTLPLTAGGTGATTASAALTALGAAPLASPTFTGTLTAPIYASVPQNLTDAATISWNPASGLNASVTLGDNRTLSFSTAPASGSYGTLVVTQDATGGRTLTLPSGTNKVLGSTSTTTVTLSSAANAKDILNFYFDGTTYFWNIGQGYGTAATITANNIAGGAAGSIPYQTGAGATGFLAKGTDGQILTLASGVPFWTAAAATGVTSVAMTTPTGLSVSGSPITSSGTLALSMTSGYAIPTTASQTNWDAAYTNRITSATSPLSISSNALSLGTVPVSSGGTGAITLTSGALLKGNGTSAITAATAGTDYSAGTSLLQTGILKSTTSTGALTIAAASDFPTLNQSTTGNASTATKLAASKNINGVAFDGSSDITISASAGTLSGTVAVANGGTGVTTAAANAVFAGPASGASPAAPSFRGLVAADFPSGSTNYINNTTTQQTASFNISGSGTVGTDLTLSALTASKPVFTDADKKLTSAGTLGVSQGGTGLSSTPTNGQILIGNGAGFALATLTVGSGITITNNSGSITIAAAIRPTTDEFTATAGQTAFTLSQTPLTNTTTSPVKPNVWMFINGVRTKNLAYAVSGTSVTYTASSNNSYTLVAGDRIQFDYAY